MLVPTLIAFLAAGGAAAPLSSYQQDRLAALLVWADAYGSCYEPAPYSETIDRSFTTQCIELALHHATKDASVDERAALAALIIETPHLVDVINAPPAAPASAASGVQGPPHAAKTAIMAKVRPAKRAQ